MLKFRRSRVIQLAAALGCVLTAACSSGGSGGPTTVTGTSSTTTPAGGNSGGAAAVFNDTGIAGTVAAPAPATFSSAPTQLAVSGGPTFDGSSGSFPANATFPLLLSSLQKSSTGLSATAGSQGATATVVSSSANSSIAQLTIPSLGVNETFTLHTDLASRLGQVIDGLNYAVMGFWQQGQPSALQTFTAFVFGYETPQTAVPTSGTAVFSGVGTAAAYVYKPAGTEIQAGFAEGDASISVNFGSGSVTGSFTKMQIGNDQQPWNDVSVTGNITAGTNRFSGSTAAASSPAGSMSLSSSATGRIDGAFYGPAAQNVGAIWSLSDGTGSAVGTVVVGH